MVTYVRGDVVSFRITDEFTKSHLGYLNTIGGSKSRTIAKYCAMGIASEMDSKIVIRAEELPVQTREWLSNPDNIHLLVSTLQSLQSQNNSSTTERSSEPFEAQKSVSVAVSPEKLREPVEMRINDDLNDFLKQLI